MLYKEHGSVLRYELCGLRQLARKFLTTSSSHLFFRPIPSEVEPPQDLFKMLSTFVALTALAGSATAHFRMLQPTWRGDSFEAPASQWQYPCAGINATTDSANRTQWPLDGGSVVFNGSHPWSMTYVNLALGSQGSSFNITLVQGFNQTGPGVFCFKVCQPSDHHILCLGADEWRKYLLTLW